MPKLGPRDLCIIPDCDCGSFIMQDRDGNLQLVRTISRQSMLVRLTFFRSLPRQSTFVLRVTTNISFIHLLAPRHRPVYQVYANVALEVASVADSLLSL